ncbi:MAG: hypothetical protein COA71_04935 [SAR86 cluster bacterium]|uniref:Uncharacterized protein n=1 Tax=SAR86 cluster bacterium TaxID=2030880 RepID=A0A2A5CHI9_9GAMM|nr:MAG: hypothetical protein COA71_04935 [SAR86 cluster bacterium]
MNTDVTLEASPQTLRSQPDKRFPLLIAGIISAILIIYLASSYGWRQAALFLVGLTAGLALYHAAFGFTAAWREVALTGHSGGLRAQMVMLGITVLIFTPLIALGEFGGIGLRGNAAPINLAVVFGAFVFGLGMQLGGGCASGTLFTTGGGNARMLVTLAAFIIGSVIGTWHWSQWQDVPGFAPVVLSQTYGVIPAILISLALFSLVWFAAASNERRLHGSVKSYWKTETGQSWLRGPWPIIVGALVLAGINVATLLLAGRPWGVTSAFALWGGKIAGTMNIDVAAWAYWQRPAQALSLDQSILANITSVMNIGIVLGALFAAGMANKFAPSFKLPLRSLLAAIIGGLLLGYGARIAFGCNIGAYFSGIGSTSLHGWLWFVAAFIGSTLGTRIRPFFGLN